MFYSHRYDGVTPVEETMQALIDIVRSGKALYAGISKYPPKEQEYAYRLLAEAKVPCLVSQYRYSMFDTAAAGENFGLAAANGSGHAGTDAGAHAGTGTARAGQRDAAGVQRGDGQL